MGKMQQPWIAPAQLQQNTLLNLETGQAQANSLIDMCNSVFGAQLDLAHCCLGFISGNQGNASWPAEIKDSDFGRLASGQAEFTKALSEAGADMTRRTLTLAQAYWNEQQRQMKALLDA
jgi:hypothetical protein